MKFGQGIKRVIIRSLSLKSLKCHLKVIMKLIRYLQDFSKHVLGVHSKASNFAVLSELGQLPLIVSSIASCINF